ncbi:hypothetical protein TWF730_008808 [Orbilia blumenaviensis]|uniref:Phosphoglycerate mutase-like protein n=1 Tax=Orbilia blumenaviensis TaxID=1796055 RepID=A0AAV9V3E9_9PEZI
MAPNTKIILIRHGQATHNLEDDFQQPDPRLTDLGKQQCVEGLRDAFAGGEWEEFKNLELVVVSPLFRTLETAFLAFGKEFREGNVPFVVLPEVQETSPNPCDTGSSVESLKKTFPSLDFSNCERHDWLTKSHGFYTRNNLGIRATCVRKWLFERPESVIAVVTHSGFLRWLTPQDFPFVENRDKYRNCEYRGYTFAPITSDDGEGSPFKLVEEHWSVELRKVKRAGELDSPTGTPAPAEVAAETDASGNLGGDGAFDDPEQPTIVF